MDLNTKGRVIHIGPKGGYYVLEKGKKIYSFKRAGAPPKESLLSLNTKGRVIHIGPKGGYYVLEKGKKIYSFKRAGAPPKESLLSLNTKGRVIHIGPKGGYYVLEGGKKIYKFTRAPSPKPKTPSPKANALSPKLKRVSPLKRLLEKVRKRRVLPVISPGGEERVLLKFKHFYKDGRSIDRTLTIFIPKAKNEMMSVEKDTLPMQSWLDAQGRYLDDLDDYDFYTAMSYTVRSHQWIGPYMRTKKLSDVRFTKPFGFVMPLVYQFEKIAKLKSSQEHTDFEKHLLTLTSNSQREDYVNRMSEKIPKNVLKEALELYIKDLKRIVSKAPKLPRTMVVYRGVKDDIFKGKIGTVHKVEGFASAAYVPQRVYAPNNYLRIKLLKGSRVLLLQCLNDWGHEGEFEVLVNYGSRYLIRKRNLRRPVLNSMYGYPVMKYVTDVTVF